MLCHFFGLLSGLPANLESEQAANKIVMVNKIMIVNRASTPNSVIEATQRLKINITQSYGVILSLHVVREQRPNGIK